MKVLEEAGRKALQLFINVNWIRWVCDGTRPAYSNEEKLANAALGMLGKHCSMCLNLNGCCFPKNNMPQYPLHPNYHCRIAPIGSIATKAECDLIKFTEYIFVDTSKKVLFERWGYGIIDS